MNEIDILQYGFADAKLYSCKYPKAEELNPILHDVIVNRTKNSEHPNNMGALMSQPYDFTVKEFNIIVEYVKEVLGNLKDAPYPYKSNPLKLVEVWGQYYKEDAYQISHYHAHSDWAFVYYVNTPPGCSPTLFAGKKIRPKEGQLIMFMGHHYHGVPTSNVKGRSVMAGLITYEPN